VLSSFSGLDVQSASRAAAIHSRRALALKSVGLSIVLHKDLHPIGQMLFRHALASRERMKKIGTEPRFNMPRVSTEATPVDSKHAETVGLGAVVKNPY
jgi:hypothetical protein